MLFFCEFCSKAACSVLRVVRFQLRCRLPAVIPGFARPFGSKKSFGLPARFSHVDVHTHTHITHLSLSLPLSLPFFYFFGSPFLSLDVLAKGIGTCP